MAAFYIRRDPTKQHLRGSFPVQKELYSGKWRPFRLARSHKLEYLLTARCGS